MIMRNSVFNAIKTHHKKILMVKRRDEKGSWYLPGGKVDFKNDGPKQAGSIWTDRLINNHTTIYHDTNFWMLSPGAGGSPVYLNVYSNLNGLGEITLHDPANNRFISDIAIFDVEQIGHHLYQTGLLPWGQAKMALWALFLSGSKEPYFNHSPLLRDDLGWVGGIKWKKP